MIPLPLTTHKLQAVLAGAVTTNQLKCTVVFYDITKGDKKDFSEYRRYYKFTDTNSTTDVDICSAPSQDIIRHIEAIFIYNNDTVNATATVKIDVSGTDQILKKHTLTTGQTLTYEHGLGWQVL